MRVRPGAHGLVERGLDSFWALSSHSPASLSSFSEWHFCGCAMGLVGQGSDSEMETVTAWSSHADCSFWSSLSSGKGLTSCPAPS